MPHLARRITTIAALIAAPALAVALALSATEGYRLVRPESPLFGDPPPRSLVEAITRRAGVDEAYAFIHAGQDPNEPVAVDDPDYTGGRTVKVSPLMVAVAARDSNVVLMLLNVGARLDLPQNRLAGCLAQELGDEEITSILARDGVVGVPSICRERRSDAPTPLLAWVD